jgi:hypothetical protein
VSCEIALRQILLASPAGTAAGGRIYPLIRPQGSPLPALTYQRIAEARFDPVQKPGTPYLTMARLQYDAWAASYGAVVDLALKVQQALKYAVSPDPAPGAGRDVCGVVFDSQEQLYETETTTYRVRMDFDVFTEE